MDISLLDCYFLYCFNDDIYVTKAQDVMKSGFYPEVRYYNGSGWSKIAADIMWIAIGT